MSALADLYARIPAVKGCRTGCSDCCGPVPMTSEEERAVPSPMRPEPFGAMFITPTKGCGTCAYSTASGCSIYSSRPFMCRLFGAVSDEPRLHCPHGAKSDQPLNPAEAAALADEYRTLLAGTTS